MLFKFRAILDDMIDIVYPRATRCIACDRDCNTYNRYGFCHTCFDSLPFVEDPRCSVCGRHFSGEGRCDECKNVDHVFTRAISVFEYEPPASDIVHKFKYKSYTALAEPMSMLMVETVEGEGWEIDTIIPVPLHVNRLRRRGYNQASYLAHSMGKLMGRIEVLDTALVRKRDTPSQIGMDRAGRMWNLYNAFEISNKSLVEGKTVLLVDDVLTTGSTVDNCSSKLLEAGAKDVYVSTFAVSIFHNI